MFYIYGVTSTTFKTKIQKNSARKKIWRKYSKNTFNDLPKINSKLLSMKKRILRFFWIFLQKKCQQFNLLTLFWMFSSFFRSPPFIFTKIGWNCKAYHFQIVNFILRALLTEIADVLWSSKNQWKFLSMKKLILRFVECFLQNKFQQFNLLRLFWIFSTFFRSPLSFLPKLGGIARLTTFK